MNALILLYRKPSVSYEWFDDFVHNYDRSNLLMLVFFHYNIFNICLLKPHSYWDTSITLLGLNQLVKSTTRNTQTSATLIDYM